MNILNIFKRTKQQVSISDLDDPTIGSRLDDLENKVRGLQTVINRHEALIYKRKRANDMPEVEQVDDLSWLNSIKY